MTPSYIQLVAYDPGVAPATTFDLCVRNGSIVDGLGGEPFVGDVAISDAVIAAVGSVDGGAAREIDATGLLVTPGFIDLHTHYDGQAIWSDRMTPSSAHGVTTAVMGNCGVGFAPCRGEDHDVLVDVMAGVEDIPGVVMTDGLPVHSDSRRRGWPLTAPTAASRSPASKPPGTKSWR